MKLGMVVSFLLQQCRGGGGCIATIPVFFGSVRGHHAGGLVHVVRVRRLECDLPAAENLGRTQRIDRFIAPYLPTSC